MQVTKVQQIITPKSTGYTAAACTGLAILSGACHNKSFKKLHKPLAWSSALITLMHIVIIEYYYHKYSNKSNN